jgi:hypothetical protein
MIAAGEWPEEGNGQAGYVWIALEYRTSIRLLPPTTLSIKASIENIYRAIVPQGVIRRHIGQTPFEAVIETHYLKPLAAIAIDIEWRDRPDPGWLAGTSPKQQDKQCKYRQRNI